MVDKTPTYSRSELIEIANITGTQLDYFVKLGVVAPDVGDVRKRYSREEAVLVILTAAMVHFGMTPTILARPMDWLRKEVNLDESNGLWENIRYALSHSKPLFLMVFTSEERWDCKWSNKVERLEGVATWHTFDLTRILNKLRWGGEYE